MARLRRAGELTEVWVPDAAPECSQDGKVLGWPPKELRSGLGRREMGEDNSGAGISRRLTKIARQNRLGKEHRFIWRS
jgi:hypothetical protein